MTHKILLVYDDYAEMIRIQTDLMKVGFDVVGIVNEHLMADQLLSFNPHLVMTAGRGGKVSAPSVAQKLKDNARFLGRVVILLPSTQRPTAEELARIRMDILLEFPAPFPKILGILARLLNLDGATLIEKYRKIRASEGASQEELSQLKPPPPDRASRFEKALKSVQIDTKATTFDRQVIKEKQDVLKKDWNTNDLNDLNEHKIRFAKALFKK